MRYFKLKFIRSSYRKQSGFPNFVYAQYIQDTNNNLLPEEKNNPLICAFPEKINDPRYFKVALTSTSIFFDDTKKWSKDKTLKSLKLRFPIFYIVFYDVSEVYNAIYDMILCGYVNRSPLSKENTEALFTNPNIQYEKIIRKIISQDTENNIHSGVYTGCSGMGKSILVYNILSLIPQCIIHDRKFKNIKFLITPYIQITYLKFNMPPESSRSGIGLAFFESLDNALKNIPNLSELDKNWHDRALKAKNIPQLKALMMKACARYSIGILIIDEIQRLSLQRTKNKDEIQEFFVAIMTSGVPVFLMGLPEAITEIFSSISVARRFSTDFESKLRVHKKKSDEWKFFVEKIFDHENLLKLEIKCNLSQELHDLIRGVSFLLVKFAKHIYEYLIKSDNNVVDKKLLDTIYLNEFSLLHGPLIVLMNGDEALFSQAYEALIKKYGINDALDSGSFSREDQEQNSSVTINDDYETFTRTVSYYECSTKDELHQALLKDDITFDSESFDPYNEI